MPARQPRPRRQRLTDRELLTAGDAGRARAAVNRKAEIDAARKLAVELATRSPYGVVGAEDLAHELKRRLGIKAGRWVGSVWIAPGLFAWTGYWVVCRREAGPGNKLKLWRLTTSEQATGRKPRPLPEPGPGAILPWPLPRD
ncbi:MAG: hypothetical protein KDA44_09405 [Planctomycetales bacterium]|nr:hypothetical protein [Planctomycetales bacterium]